jgi:hypothetical protein
MNNCIELLGEKCIEVPVGGAQSVSTAAGAAISLTPSSSSSSSTKSVGGVKGKKNFDEDEDGIPLV